MAGPPDTSPSAARLLRLVEGCLDAAGATRGSYFHGEGHWMRVAWVGAHLCREEPDADATVVLAFSCLHDTRRVNEHRDPGHGPRAAALARELNGPLLGLEPERLDVLAHAIHTHTSAGPTAEVTLGSCYDADRLTLWRVGIEPDPAFLSRAWSRRPQTIAWTRRLQDEPLTWHAVADRYAALLDAERTG